MCDSDCCGSCWLIFRTLAGFALYIADFVTDVILAAEYYRNGHYYWFGLTLGFALGPQIIVNIVLAFQDDDCDCCPYGCKWSRWVYMLPLGVPIKYLQAPASPEAPGTKARAAPDTQSPAAHGPRAPASTRTQPRQEHSTVTLHSTTMPSTSYVREITSFFYTRHMLLSEERSLYKHDGIHITPDAGLSFLVADVKRTLRQHQQSTHDPRRTARQTTVENIEGKHHENNMLCTFVMFLMVPMAAAFNPTTDVNIVRNKSRELAERIQIN
uniref:XK-related protein n=1 Tax=Branchiostoma floridae TaxID=7739 RepID=C3XRX0_BRAFL|eukprot:XP_002613429.1 hypothetical protein BRAFLDRAFT_84552 [Branchiostoma floridae]